MPPVHPQNRGAKSDRLLGRILREPNRWRKIRADNRKLNFHRFPYAIVYSVRADELYIKAVMHLHRRPFYWSHRQPPP